MNRFGRRDQAFAISLSAMAGYVDATGFLKAGGFFVSFMSGNSTRLAIGLVKGLPSPVIAICLIASFVAGVMLGTYVSEESNCRSRHILLLVCLLLAAASLLDWFGWPQSVFFAAAAMGAENAVFARDGDVQIGLTYMTGTLVKFGQNLALQLSGRRNVRWVSFGLLWSGLVFGAVLGALTYRYLNSAGFVFAALGALILGLLSPRENPSQPSQELN